MSKARRSCGFINGIDVDAEGSRGGLCLAWKTGMDVILKSSSKWHVDVMVKEDSSQAEWRFTGFYGTPYSRDQNQVWDLLKSLSQNGTGPRLVAGDFNEIMYSFEKNGGLSRDQRRMEIFRETLAELSVTSYSRHHRFHFEVWWTMEESFEEVLRGIWGSSSEPLIEKIKILQNGLEEWAGAIRRKKGELKKKLSQELESLLLEERDDETLARIIDTKIHLNMEIEKDEVYWEQRARVNWLQYGDKNTTYFHKSATTRRRANFITKLVADDGKEIIEDTELQEAAKIFFEKLFSSEGVADPKRVLEGINSSISPEMNEVLNSPFTADEIIVALKGMGPLKAPGSDGFPALFFQKYWHIVGKEVLEFCLGVLNDGKRVESANSTDIVLIPKTSHPTTLVNFRPISLCTVMYKLVTKTIAIRLQDVMGICIDKAQSAFVPGRLISDNVLLAYELLHTFRQKRMGKKGYMAIKLDMSKAYDRVEWDFVKQMMKQMGFALRWIELIMKCITTASYAVIINGNRGRNFQPTRGLRQGDPLSPFLFLICSEGLSALMRSTMRNGLVKGAKACQRGPEISHLLFADDCILFGEATEKGAKVVNDILKEYESCSGQCVNFNKSTIFYSTNTREKSKDLVSNLLGVRNSSSPEKYLGLPSIVGRRKKEAFLNLVDKITVRIDAWSIRLLSQGRKEIFIKSVLQAIPTYAMSFSEVFKAKYFLDCHFLDSRLGNSSSCVWRSIWATKATLEKDVIWTSDKVEALINSNSREWNRELVVDTFSAEVADLILRIPLAAEAHEDFMAWNEEPSGEFTVKSSYKLLQRSDPTAYALQIVYKDFYNKIWRLDIPTKVKIFIWKVAWNYLATKVNMMARRLATNSMCPRCGGGEETMNHLFRDCPVSTEIWMILSYLDVAAIWGERNSRIHDKMCRSGRETANFVLNYVKEMDGIKEKTQHTSFTVVKWQPPSGQGIKINFDGAFDERNKCAVEPGERRQHSGTRLSVEMRRKQRGHGFEATDLKQKLKPLS
ncbi:reverse transcriptase [Gossypium australe]|uniref:Reverse transcriptase n=1 Tax=Gossypium australe TaxID=47621 RepID=A0A5B6UD39_9ROSI|nr:reverse transcriptase [Gossypium australe]